MHVSLYSCLVDSKKERERRTRYRNRPTFECDVRIYRSCVKLAEDHTVPESDLLGVVYVRLDVRRRGMCRGAGF